MFLGAEGLEISCWINCGIAGKRKLSEVCSVKSHDERLWSLSCSSKVGDAKSFGNLIRYIRIDEQTWEKENEKGLWNTIHKAIRRGSCRCDGSYNFWNCKNSHNRKTTIESLLDGDGLDIDSHLM